MNRNSTIHVREIRLANVNFACQKLQQTRPRTRRKHNLAGSWKTRTGFAANNAESFRSGACRSEKELALALQRPWLGTKARSFFQNFPMINVRVPSSSNIFRCSAWKGRTFVCECEEETLALFQRLPNHYTEEMLRYSAVFIVCSETRQRANLQNKSLILDTGYATIDRRIRKKCRVVCSPRSTKENQVFFCVVLHR